MLAPWIIRPESSTDMPSGGYVQRVHLPIAVGVFAAVVGRLRAQLERPRDATSVAGF
jgi:hypothetical protein